MRFLGQAWWLLVLLLVLLLVAACGVGVQTSSVYATLVPGGTQSSGGTIGEDDNEPKVATDESTATVVIGDKSFAFTSAGLGTQCIPDLYGSFHAVLITPSPDGSLDRDGVFQVDLAGTVGTAAMSMKSLDWDLEADANKEWPAVPLGTSYVEDWSQDGNTATGTIVFVDTNKAWGADNVVEPMEATFEVTCAE